MPSDTPSFLAISAGDRPWERRLFSCTKELVFEKNSFPFGKDGRSISVRFFGTVTEEELAKNSYVVTHQWAYPREEGGKRLDVVIKMVYNTLKCDYTNECEVAS